MNFGVNGQNRVIEDVLARRIRAVCPDRLAALGQN
jgi:hypothetical protein